MASLSCIPFFLILGLATWHTPTGGMFLWMKFTCLEDSFPLVMERLLKRKILLVAGGAFNITENKPCPYARVAYARAPPEDKEQSEKDSTICLLFPFRTNKKCKGSPQRYSKRDCWCYRPIVF